MKRFKNIYLVIYALVIIGAIIGIYLVISRQPSLSSLVSQGQSHKLPSADKDAGNRMQFTLPAKFTELSGGSDTTKVFIQNKNGKTIRSILVYSQNLVNTDRNLAEAQALSVVGKLTTSSLSVIYYDKKAPDFQKLTLGTTLISSQPKIKPSQVGIEHFSELTESFNAKASAAQPSEIDGYIRYQIGKNTNYYIIVSSRSDYWQKDQSAWSQLLSAVSVDK